MKKRILCLCAAAFLLAASVQAEPSTSPAATGQPDLLAVDHKLYELGYRDAACNGVLDEITVTALKNFQQVNGLEPTGEADAVTVSVLMGGNAISQGDYLAKLAYDNTTRETLAYGSTGDAVSELQSAMKEHGYFSGSIDGVYGGETEAAVLRFQLANGLNESGIADGAVLMRLYNETPISWDKFLSSCCTSIGDSGNRVRRLQIWLKQKGYFTGECTGRYGDGTRQAMLRFQAENDLEESGDLDMESCRLLYSDVRSFLQDSRKLRRGDLGQEAERLCMNLAALGYPAHARFNMQTELALMQFQLVNGLEITGVADELTLECLRSEDAVPLQEYVPSAQSVPDDGGLKQRIFRQASALLGQYAELDSCFAFVQHVMLACDVELMREDQLSSVDVGPADTIEAGNIIGVQRAEDEIMGVATSDRAVIYRGENGYIIMSYLDRMDALSVCLYHFAEEA